MNRRNDRLDRYLATDTDPITNEYIWWHYVKEFLYFHRADFWAGIIALVAGFATIFTGSFLLGLDGGALAFFILVVGVCFILGFKQIVKLGRRRHSHHQHAFNPKYCRPRGEFEKKKPTFKNVGCLEDKPDVVDQRLKEINKRKKNSDTPPEGT